MRRRFGLLSVCLAFTLLTGIVAGGCADAEGVTRVQQSDGSVQLYHDVRMHLRGTTLWITSADHKGVLQVATSACTYREELTRCLPYAVTLHQHGRTHQIALRRGTVYVNLTSAPHTLPFSSQVLAPNGVLVFFHTVHGTYVSVQGTLDEVNQ